ncbi:MAG TPA: hypothetical protein VGD69_14640 [Herpetosiphonaceae bacterium]
MKYCLMLLIALFLAGCSSAPPIAQGTPPADQPSIAQPAGTDEPEPPTITTLPSPVSETAAPESPTATAIPSPVTDPPEPVSTTTVAQGPTLTPQIVGQVSSAEAEQIIAPTAKQAIEALKNRDMVRIAGMAHPEKGMAFSAYGRVDDKSVVLKPEQLAGALADPTIRLWGSYDGTGDPIELTFAAYFERFVYSHDFAAAPEIGYNQALGDIYNYADDFDPGSIFVEYHFPGFDPQYEGMDWQSLRLVFEQQDQTWYLVGILHNQWMI